MLREQCQLQEHGGLKKLKGSGWSRLRSWSLVVLPMALAVWVVQLHTWLYGLACSFD